MHKHHEIIEIFLLAPKVSLHQRRGRLCLRTFLVVFDRH